MWLCGSLARRLPNRRCRRWVEPILAHVGRDNVVIVVCGRANKLVKIVAEASPFYLQSDKPV